jgi:hypothetical protein
MNRVMPHFDFHAGSDFRLFSEFEFDYEDGRNGGPRSQIDEDRGDVHQLFLEIGPHVSSSHGISLRAGRQEIVLGSGRLFDNNEGPNAKLSFDGFRLIAEGGHARLDLFAVKPVENNLGWFDDVPNHAESLWGSYLTVPVPIVSRGQADFYYIGLDTKSANYNRGTAHEVRETAGTRVFRPIGKGLDYNWEPNYQWGMPRFAPGAFQRRLDIRWIAYGFILDHCYGRTYTAATAIRRISLSVPSIPFFRVAHTLLPL